MGTPISRAMAFACLLMAICPAVEAGDTPRYAMTPGQVLTYEEEQAFTGKNEDSSYMWTRRFWIVGRNADGSWRVVAREAMTEKPKPNLRDLAVNVAEAIRNKGFKPEAPETVTFARFDLHPDGTIPPCATLGTRIDPSHVFPRLPRSEAEASQGWASHDVVDDATTRYRPLAADGAATFDFEADQSTFMEKGYDGSDRRTFHFDRESGRVTRAEVARSYGGHLAGKGTGTTTLKSAEALDPAALATFSAEMDRFFDARHAYDDLMRQARTAGDGIDALYAKARVLLSDARAKVALPEPVAALDAEIKNHDAYSRYGIEDAKRFAALIGRPSPDWQVKDLDGKTHALADYRGQVVVLDFWYRACGWCMRAMPQVKGVAAHYKGRPVAVFGASSDRDDADAAFVVKTMGLAYPVLRSQDLPGKYGVQGFPTLVIIDRHGNVADVHVGYSADLFAEVKATVDRLLETK